jgi:hypothetical protein
LGFFFCFLWGGVNTLFFGENFSCKTPVHLESLFHNYFKSTHDTRNKFASYKIIMRSNALLTTLLLYCAG